MVPYIGLYLKDLTAMKDGSGDTLDNGHISWKGKFKKMADVLHKVRRGKEERREGRGRAHILEGKV
jgi:hypothetical protein